MSDPKFATRFRKSLKSVLQRRKLLGITSYKVRRGEEIRKLRASVQRRDVPRLKWSPEDRKLLGNDTDRNIAARLGRTVKAVKRMRERLGIKAFAPTSL